MLEKILNTLNDEIHSYSSIALRSAFQPIISLSHQRIVGYEGLIRGFSAMGDSISPIDIFKIAESNSDIIYLDRLCRALHINTFRNCDDDINWLFLNVNPDVVVNGRKQGQFFAQLLELMQIKPERIVIEILESPSLDEKQLFRCADFYHEMGCLIAIDDFGAGHSNFQRIWRIKPQIVKLDQHIIRHACINNMARRMLPNIVATMHEAGSLVLMEGIENEQESMIAMEANIDLVQGYYFSRPAFTLDSNTNIKPIVENLFTTYKANFSKRIKINPYLSYIEAMQSALVKLQVSTNLDDWLHSISIVLNLPGADRYYLLDENGIQIGESYLINKIDEPAYYHFKPMSNGNKANWIRRPYLQRALQEYNKVHITRPYLSIANGRLCITLSTASIMHGSIIILCYDIDISKSA